MTAGPAGCSANATVQVVGNRPRMAARLPGACAVMSEIAGGHGHRVGDDLGSPGFHGTRRGRGRAGQRLVVRAEGWPAAPPRGVVETSHEQRRPSPRPTTQRTHSSDAGLTCRSSISPHSDFGDLPGFADLPELAPLPELDALQEPAMPEIVMPDLEMPDLNQFTVTPPMPHVRQTQVPGTDSPTNELQQPG